MKKSRCLAGSGITKTLLVGWVANPENQNVEENEENLRKNERYYRKLRKALILPTWSERLVMALLADYVFAIRLLTMKKVLLNNKFITQQHLLACTFKAISIDMFFTKL